MGLLRPRGWGKVGSGEHRDECRRDKCSWYMTASTCQLNPIEIFAMISRVNSQDFQLI